MEKSPTQNNQKNLRVGGHARRTWKKAKAQGKAEYKSPREIYEIIHRGEWPYKTRPDFYRKRDRALAALVYLTSGRINEALRVKRRQIREDPDDPDFLVVHSFWISKRKGGKYDVVDIPLPRVGKLAPFTELVEEYLDLVEPEEKLFRFGSSRALAIIEYMTRDPDAPETLDPDAHYDKSIWCHYLRAQSLTYMVNLLRSTIIVAKDRGIVNPQTLAHYYTGEWKEHKEELKK